MLQFGANARVELVEGTLEFALGGLCKGLPESREAGNDRVRVDDGRPQGEMFSGPSKNFSLSERGIRDPLRGHGDGHGRGAQREEGKGGIRRRGKVPVEIPGKGLVTE